MAGVFPGRLARAVQRGRAGSGEESWSWFCPGRADVEPLLHTTFAERNGSISPRHGRRVAYESNESGQEEIYVRPFPNVTEGQWQISTGGGKDPVWAPKGNELFYRDGTSVMAAAVQTAPVFQATSPVRLFDGPYVTALASGFDVSRDGQRFLMTEGDRQPAIGDNRRRHQLAGRVEQQTAAAVRRDGLMFPVV